MKSTQPKPSLPHLVVGNNARPSDNRTIHKTDSNHTYPQPGFHNADMST
jgi:hypothetical protein